MGPYSFELRFALADPEQDPAECLGALTTLGHEHALIGIGRHGRIAFDFDLEASTAEKAIRLAFEAVVAALPGGRLLDAAPDLVGLTVLADHVGCSRQHLHKLSTLHPSFPKPVHVSSVDLYHLDEILTWLNERDAWPLKRASKGDQLNVRRRAGQRLLEVARATRRLNAEQEWLRHAASPTSVSQPISQKYTSTCGSDTEPT